MAELFTPNSVASFQNDTTAVNTVNGNFAAISTAFTDVLSRSGVSPNQMTSGLDMNSNQIFNLPPPGTVNSPARLADVTSTNISLSFPSLIGDVTAPSNNGALTTTVVKVDGVSYPTNPTTNTVPVVTSANTVTYEAVPGSAIAINTVTNTNLAQMAANTVKGNSIGGLANATDLTTVPIPTMPALTGDVTTTVGTVATTISNNAVSNAKFRQGVARSIVGVTGNATTNVADIQGTTRQVLAVNTAGTAAVFAQPQGDQLLGTTTNDNATAGNVGEFVTSTVVSGSAVTFTTNTTANITSISLTAGDWDVWATPVYQMAGTTSYTQLLSSISNVSGSDGSIASGSSILWNTPAAVPTNDITQPIPPVRISLTTTTTIFLVGHPTFTVSTCKGYGTINARRVR